MSAGLGKDMAKDSSKSRVLSLVADMFEGGSRSSIAFRPGEKMLPGSGNRH